MTNMILNNVESYLADLESSYSDIVENAEKKIRWYDGKQKTRLSIIYLHGFSASRRELSPVTEQLADKLGANVYFVRLRGHGRSDDAMAEAKIEDWLNDTRLAYQIGKLIGQKVVTISTSTGGTLATWLAAQEFASQLAANIMISPNFGIKDRSGEIIRWPWGLQIAKWINGPYRSFEPQNQTHDDYWTQRYPIEALVPVIKLVDQVLDMDKSKISAPQLLVYSPNDKVISVSRILQVSEEFSAGNVVIHPFTESSDPSQHVLAGDACSPDTTQVMVDLLEKYLEQLNLK